MARYEGISSADNPDAGFRAATQDAVEKFKAAEGAPEPGKPVRLKVVEMYVSVQNPIHDYRIILSRDR